MPKVTYFEAQNLLERLDWKISNIHNKIQNLLNRPEEKVTEEVSSVGGGEVRIVDSKYPESEETLDALENKLDELNLERVRIGLAMRKFEVTQTFDY